MVRTYKKKKDKPPPTDAEIVSALVLLKTSGKSLREVAVTSDCSNLQPETKIKPTFHHLPVLTPTQEQELTDNLIESRQRRHGLTPKKLKVLLYSYAFFNGIPMV
ncbi:hypothetical protein OUZ56_011410 [Daphnia magna]|uniref:Uncharacterized protein n=1 Tax=Daphnia magna TaxID=35525 RepID=A0ABQ9Z033_9CRUS|nr:hypothetical protein OUZ56_011410 [Daphnia magna]